MSEMVKRDIRQKALARRERHLLDQDDRGIAIGRASEDVSCVNTTSVRAPRPISRASISVDESTADAVPVLSSLLMVSAELPAHQSLNGYSEDFQSPSTTNPSISGPVTIPFESSLSSPTASSFAAPIPVHFGAVMIYLDYVFPFFFPFYHPSLPETGRQWLLGLLCQNQVSFHLAASLSAYFFSLVAQNDEQDVHDDCKSLVQGWLFQQMDLALKAIQTSISRVNRREAQSGILDMVGLMEEITQLLTVEVAVRRSVDWNIHLSPALVLFDELFKTYGMDDSETSLAILLGALPSPLPHGAPHTKLLPCTADQSALVFFTSLLLFVDILASTSLGRSPVLQTYHQSLLFCRRNEKCNIQLEAIIGCQNWALAAIGKISALCAWKRDAQSNGNFSIFSLVSLAEPIAQALEEGLTGLERDIGNCQPTQKGTNRPETYYSQHGRNNNQTSVASITCIWAYAARIYLSVSLSGWQTNDADTQASVSKILELLRAVESPAQLRSLAWPITIAGCLALPSQEHEFRHMTERLGHLGDFGTIQLALRILESVWNSRDTVNRKTWDICLFLNILGSPALLF